MDIAKVTEQYYANNAEKLHKVVDGILKGFGGLAQKDKDDFYSLANEVFWIAANDFNGRGNFNGFLYSRLVLKIRSAMTERNRQKRSDIQIVIKKDGTKEKIFHQTLSFNAPVKSNDGKNRGTLGEITPSSFNLEESVADEIGLSFSPDVAEYLNKLPKKTRKIALMIGDGYKPCDICEKMQIEEREYQIHMEIIHTYEYRKPMEWRYLR